MPGAIIFVLILITLFLGIWILVEVRMQHHKDKYHLPPYALSPPRCHVFQTGQDEHIRTTDQYRALAQTIQQQDTNDPPYPPVRLRLEPSGFILACEMHEPPAGYRRLRAYSRSEQDKNQLQFYLFVGCCQWLIADDGSGIVGVQLRTDITSSESRITWGGPMEVVERMQDQNQESDLAWAIGAIRWLWEQALPGKAAPYIAIAPKLEIHEYIDIY